MWIDRLLREKVEGACAARPSVLVTGARQTGKSSLLQRLFPDVEYISFDRVAMAAEAEENPGSFLDRFSGKVILDEIQYVPSLFRELKIRIDANRMEKGRWIMTGSQRFELMKGVSESLAGRLRILQLETLSAGELRASGHFSNTTVKDVLWKGGYPELWADPSLEPGEFYEDYIQTYLERDLKEIVQVANLRDFQRFIVACASRVGQLVNYTDLARDVGISPNTAKSWVGALEASGIVYTLPPYFANVGKRLVKASKLFFADNGLLCHMLNIQNQGTFARSPMRGQIWENLVFSEMVKTLEAKPGRNLFFYRDQNGVEMDCIMEHEGRLVLVEAKAAERVDSRKLNFSRVAPLFGGREMKCILMNTNAEPSPVSLKEYSMANPLKHDLSTVI